MRKLSKKIVAVVLSVALFLTSVPELFVIKASAATAWKVLEEKDLPVDELYGEWGSYLIGRKDGKLALVDSNLKLVKKTEYDQIEGSFPGTFSYELLVSRTMNSGSEYASIDGAGKTTVYGIYKKAESLNLVGLTLLYAEKENGECGFILDGGKEIGFDKSFVYKPEKAVVEYNIVCIGERTYYVKQYFETQAIYDKVGEFYSGTSIKEMKEKLHSEQCNFIFYDETGTVVDIEPLIAEYEKAEKDEEERKKQDAQVITELEQTAASQLPIREYVNNTLKMSTGKYTVNDVTAHRFGDMYLAYVKADVEFAFEDDYDDPIDFVNESYYFAGFFDREKRLVKFGQVIALDKFEYSWDEENIYLTIRDNDKKIYFYANTENMVKFLYTDTDGTFTDYDEWARVFPDCVILKGYERYLVAGPKNDFVTTTSMCARLKEENALKAEYVISDDNNGKKQALFYDSEWKQIKSIDISHINGDILLCDGVVLGKSCVLLYKTKSGYYGLIGMDGSIVVDAEKEKYIYGSVRDGYFEKSHVLLEKDEQYYYYYEDDFIPHTEEEYENWEKEDENNYGDIKYDKDYLYDDKDELIGVCEKVTDCDGNVIVSHEVTGETYNRDRYENFVYIFKDCKSIVVVDRHWNGEREGNAEEATPTPDATAPPTSAVTASPTLNVTASPKPTSKPIITESPKSIDEPNTSTTHSPLVGTVLEDNRNNVSYKVLTQDKTVAFYQVKNKKATKIAIPSTVTMNGTVYKVTAISNNAFSGCKKLKSVTISKSVTTIGNKAFFKCISLKKMTLPASIIKIGKKAFYGCKKLKSITIKSKKFKSNSVGTQAFKALNKKAVIKVPKKQKKEYEKWLKKKGITKKMKIK